MQAKHWQIVFGQWGFDRKLALEQEPRPASRIELQQGTLELDLEEADMDRDRIPAGADH